MMQQMSIMHTLIAVQLTSEINHKESTFIEENQILPRGDGQIHDVPMNWV